ncbi:MAG: hypothetical protein WCH46_06885 [bacterium]
MSITKTIPHSRQYFWYGLLLFSLILLNGSQSLVAQTLTASSKHSSACGSNQCCQEFNFDPGASTVDKLDIFINDTSCWDWSCFESNNFQAVTVSSGFDTVTTTDNTHSGASKIIELTFTPAISSGVTANFTLCPVNGCDVAGGNVSWKSYHSSSENGNGGFTLTSCDHDSMSILSPADSGGCMGIALCCKDFRMHVLRAGTKWFRITIAGNSAADTNCLTLYCARQSVDRNDTSIQLISTEHVQISNGNSINGPITIDIWTDQANGWVVGDVLSITLCVAADEHSINPSATCFYNWGGNVEWWSYDTPHPDATHPHDHNYGDSTASGWCGLISPCNPNCDKITRTTFGGYVTFCVQRSDWDVQADSIVVTIKPGLKPCDTLTFTGDVLRKVHCDTACGGVSHRDTIWHRYPPSYTRVPYLVPCNGNCDRDSAIQGWDSTMRYTTSPATETIVFKPTSGYFKLPPCGTWCMKVKKCTPYISDTITIQSYPLGNPGGNCYSAKDTVNLKKAAESHTAVFVVGDEQNYPNPVSSDHDFKTTIPFTLPTGGEAGIRVLDATGKLILEETMSFDEGGKHFFYFTGSQLPSGKYFYQIEQPKGKVLLSKSLIILK